MTKPLAGRGGTRIVGTIGGTTHRPPIMSALDGVAYSAGGKRECAADTHHTTTDHELRTEPAELPSRPTL